MPALLILFVVWPLVEIALFVLIGGQIGVLATLSVIILSAVIGVALLRSNGARTVLDLRRSMAAVGDPARPLAHGALRMLGAALLVLPGFLTDAVGLLLLLPPVRRLVLAGLGARIARGLRARARPGAARSAVVIDGEAVVVEPSAAPPARGNSGWTRH